MCARPAPCAVVAAYLWPLAIMSNRHIGNWNWVCEWKFTSQYAGPPETVARVWAVRGAHRRLHVHALPTATIRTPCKGRRPKMPALSRP